MANRQEPARIQGRLLLLAGGFLLVYTLALSLAPAVRARSWAVNYPWSHWGALLLWAVLFGLAHWQSLRLPRPDPYLLPAAALLSGWGLLGIWRLYPAFGLRQAAWLAAGVGVVILGLRLPPGLAFLRRYKYLWLTAGLALTALTLVMGVNPLGGGLPRMWLGCCGLYLQPSEPLKLLLVVYLAAYLASGWVTLPDLPFAPLHLLPLLAPTLVMTALALALLVVQRDLGTASILLFLYAALVYVASGRKRFLAAAALAVGLAALAGYQLFDVVRLRVDAWLNPWLDPSGRSYQIVQSLLAVANGGLAGRGPGLGSPTLVPVPHSDFIFAALAEETGLPGALGLIIVLALLCGRALAAALHAGDPFRRFLAAGLAAYLGGQSILIIGGNLRLLPLTGVTLPFVSYGGSSLLISFISLLLLLLISSRDETPPAPLANPAPFLHLGGLLLVGLAAAGLAAGYWSYYRGPDLLTRTDNPRRAIADRYERRGALLDRGNLALNVSEGQPGSYERHSTYPPLSSILGYTHPAYGQAGLEASLDGYLRGLLGNPGRLLWWNHLLYGQPPPGLDVRLSLDLHLQQAADELLGDHQGAAVLLNAQTGEILVMASHPTFDANRLEETWSGLVRDPASPLINRAAQGQYPPGAALGPLLLAGVYAGGQLPAAPTDIAGCAQPPGAPAGWQSLVANGCPAGLLALNSAMSEQQVLALYRAAGLFSEPNLRLPVAPAQEPDPSQPAEALALGQSFSLSPLQLALAAAALANGGERPAGQLVTAVNLPETGWVVLAPAGREQAVVLPAAAAAALKTLASSEQPTWQTVASAPSGGGKTVSWFVGGTRSDPPLVAAVLLEDGRPAQAAQVGQALLLRAVQPE